MPKEDLQYPVAGQQARDAAHLLDLEAGRRVDIPVRNIFVASSVPGTKSPMVDLYKGSSRGGATVIRLYLAILWRASRRPFEVTATASFWAALLDLKNPTTSGAVSVRRALEKLQSRGLIEYRSRQGMGTIVTVFREDGRRAEYSLPSAAYRKAKNDTQRKRHSYLRVPIELWTSGVIQKLSGPALVMLLILLSEYSPTASGVWFSETRFKDKYGLSSRTRAEGFRELKDRGIVLERSVPVFGQNVVGAKEKDLRRRKIYNVLLPRHPQVFKKSHNS